MANFVVNIGEKPNINFSTALYTFTRQDCLPLNESMTVAIMHDDEIPYILNTFNSDNPYDNIYITAKNDITKFFLEYNNIKITTSNSPIIIDIEGLTGSDPIPGLTLNIDNLTLATNLQLKFDIQIEDTMGFFSDVKEWIITLIHEACPYEPPIAVNDSASVDKGESVNISILNNDIYDTNPPTIVFTQQPVRGDTLLNANNTVTYTHDNSNVTPGSTDTDSFKYKLQEHGLESNTATVNITIREPFDLNDDAYTIDLGESRFLNVLNNDNLPTQPYNFFISQSPLYGTASVVTIPGQDSQIQYNHNGSSTNSLDRLWYKISKGGVTKEAYVQLLISRWIQRNTQNVNSDGYWLDVDYGPTLGRFIAVGLNNNSVSGMYSNNGINWSAMQIGSNTVNWEGVGAGTDGSGDLFLAVRNGQGDAIATSRNGISWTRRDLPMNRSWSDVAYGNNIAVAVAKNGSNNIAYSTNAGVSWNMAIYESTTDLWKVKYLSDGRFWAVGGHPSSSSGYIQYSTNGNNWTHVSIPIGGLGRKVRDIAYGNGVYIAICDNSGLNAGANTNAIIRSTNGITWSDVNNYPFPEASYRSGIAFGESITGDPRFYIVYSETNHDDYVIYSTDGLSWNTQEAHDAEGWTAITHGQNKFVAVSSDRASGNSWKVMTKDW